MFNDSDSILYSPFSTPPLVPERPPSVPLDLMLSSAKVGEGENEKSPTYNYNDYTYFPPQIKNSNNSDYKSPINCKNKLNHKDNLKDHINCIDELHQPVLSKQALLQNKFCATNTATNVNASKKKSPSVNHEFSKASADVICENNSDEKNNNNHLSRADIVRSSGVLSSPCSPVLTDATEENFGCVGDKSDIKTSDGEHSQSAMAITEESQASTFPVKEKNNKNFSNTTEKTQFSAILTKDNKNMCNDLDGSNTFVKLDGLGSNPKAKDHNRFFASLSSSVHVPSPSASLTSFSNTFKLVNHRNLSSLISKSKNNSGLPPNLHKQAELQEGQNEGKITGRFQPPSTASFCRIFGDILKMAIPSSLSMILSFSSQSITQSFIGRRIGPDAMSHYGVSISIFNLFGLSIGCGLIGALDTLVSQSYGRYKQASSEIGEYIQRSLIINALLMIPLGAIFMTGGPVFRLIFGEELGSAAAEFLWYSVPNLFLGLCCQSLLRTLQGINEANLPLYAMTLTCASAFFFNHYLIKDNFVTSVLVLTLIQFTQMCALIFLIIVNPRVTFYRNCSWPISKKTCTYDGIREYFDIGLPSLISCIAEWWAFETLQIIAANISIRDVALLNMMISVGSMMFSVALGVSIATSVCVGNSLGANDGNLAKKYARFALLIDQMTNTCTVSTLMLFRYQIASLYTNDEDLQKSFASLAVIVGIYHWGDSTQFCTQGIFRGSGKQNQAVQAVLLSLWAVGIPSSFIFGKVLKYGASGIMGGLIIGFLIEIPILLFYFSRWNWEEIAFIASCCDENNNIVVFKDRDEKLGENGIKSLLNSSLKDPYSYGTIKDQKGNKQKQQPSTFTAVNTATNINGNNVEFDDSASTIHSTIYTGISRATTQFSYTSFKTNSSRYRCC